MRIKREIQMGASGGGQSIKASGIAARTGRTQTCNRHDSPKPKTPLTRGGRPHNSPPAASLQTISSARRYHNRRAGKVFPGTDPASLQDEGFQPVALPLHWPLARRHSLVSRSIIRRSHEPYAHFRSTLSSRRQELSDKRWAGAARSSQMASRAGTRKSTPSRTPPMSASQNFVIRTPLMMTVERAAIEARRPRRGEESGRSVAAGSGSRLLWLPEPQMRAGRVDDDRKR